MKPVTCVFLSLAALAPFAAAQNNNSTHNPTWWAKYQYLATHAPALSSGQTASLSVGANIDVSNECGPQSETFVSLNPNHPKILAGGSNEIFRLPQRNYFSSDGGTTWGGVDMPLPPPLSGTNDTRFASDPGLAFDTQGNVFSSYIVVFFGNGSGVNGTEMAVAKSTDSGQTYPSVTFFSFASGSDHFNDKPFIAADTNARSSFRDNIYVAWDAASGGSSQGGIRLARSSDHGTTFSVTRADNPSGPSQGIGADPFVGPYPACDADRSSGLHRGRLYCSWMDLTPRGNTDIFLSFSDDQGTTWSAPRAVTDQFGSPVDRFNQWLSVDPVTGDVNASFYDTRNDTTGQRFQTDIYLSQSKDGGETFRSPNTRVTDVSSNEHDCSGVFPCFAIDYGNQQGDYAGLVSFGGISHPLWTDSRRQLDPAPGCRTGVAMEEVFTATVQ